MHWVYSEVILEVGEVIKRANDAPVYHMREKGDERGPAAIVQCHETRGLERPRRLWASILARHARVKSWQDRHECDKDRQAMRQADAAAEPPGHPLPALEGQSVEE